MRALQEAHCVKDDMSNLTDALYWDTRHPKVREAILGDAHHNNEYLYPILDRYLDRTKDNGTVFEIGVVPGQGLLKFAKRYHAVPNGSDFCTELNVTQRVFQELYPTSKWLFHDIGAEEFPPDAGTYDIVISGGLIEHFRDFDAVIRKHIGLLKPGGLLLINTPNLQSIPRPILVDIRPCALPRT